MKRKFSVILLAVVMTVMCVIGLTACKDDKDKGSDVSKFNGEYDFYSVDVDDGQITRLEKRPELGTVKIENGKLYQMGEYVEITADGDGFSYKRPDGMEDTDLPERIKFVKIADGEYYSAEGISYICLKGQTPSYPVVG